MKNDFNKSKYVLQTIYFRALQIIIEKRHRINIFFISIINIIHNPTYTSLYIRDIQVYVTRPKRI